MKHNTTDKKVSPMGSENFIQINPNDTDGGLKVDVYKEGKLVVTENIDPATESIKDLVSTYFPYDAEARDLWYERQDPEDFNFDDPAPITPDNIEYYINPSIEDLVEYNMTKFPGEFAEEFSQGDF